MSSALCFNDNNAKCFDLCPLQVLRIYVPRGVDLWSTEFYLRMKEKPYYSMPFMARQASLDEKPSSPGVGELTNPLLVNFSGP